MFDTCLTTLITKRTLKLKPDTPSRLGLGRRVQRTNSWWRIPAEGSQSKTGKWRLILQDRTEAWPWGCWVGWLIAQGKSGGWDQGDRTHVGGSSLEPDGGLEAQDPQLPYDRLQSASILSVCMGPSGHIPGARVLLWISGWAQLLSGKPLPPPKAQECSLVHRKGINNKALWYERVGEEYMCLTQSPCCTAEINTTLQIKILHWNIWKQSPETWMSIYRRDKWQAPDFVMKDNGKRIPVYNWVTLLYSRD